MARIIVTGSTEGIGRATADALLAGGHEVLVHARSAARMPAARELLARGAEGIIGDLADPGEVCALAQQATAHGPVDAVIHNAGVIDGPSLLPVNVVAPYLLTALIPARRQIYLSSSMHRGGHVELSRADWSGARRTLSYSDSKLLVTVLMAAVARNRPGTLAHAVDPGWVPTRMGGPSATDDLAQGHVTQTWLATTDDAAARTSGQYWFHRRTERTHAAVQDAAVQDALLAALAEHTGVELAHP